MKGGSERKASLTTLESRQVTSWSRAWIVAFCLAGMRPCLQYCVQSGAPIVIPE